MQNNKEEKIFEIYRKAAANISTKIVNNIISNNEASDLNMREFLDVSELMIINMTKKFYRYNPCDRLLTETDFTEINNVCREALLKLSAKTDLIPDEEIVEYCSEQVMRLLFKTRKIEEDDQY